MIIPLSARSFFPRRRPWGVVGTRQQSLLHIRNITGSLTLLRLTMAALPRPGALLLSAVLLPALTQVTMAADHLDYSLTIDSTENADLDEAIQASSQLFTLKETPPESLYVLIDRARNDTPRIQTALSSFGYYKPKITITVDGFDVNSPSGQPPNMEDTRKTASVRIKIDKGPLYHLRDIVLEGDAPAEAHAALNLKSGMPAEAQKVLDTQKALIKKLRESGYAFAKVDPPVAYADDAAHVLDIHFTVQSGKKAKLGKITVKGLKDMRADFVRRVIHLTPGAAYQPDTLDAARARLMALGTFSSVTVKTADKPAEDDSAPVTFLTHERSLHKVAFSANYSTDLGTSASAAWSHRNLLGRAEQLNLSASATGLGGNATNGLGYDVSAQFIKPYFLNPDQQLALSVSAVKQDLDAYDQTAEVLSGLIKRKLNGNWSVDGGLALTYDDVTQDGGDYQYQMLSAPLSLSYSAVKTTGAIREPRSGYKAKLLITPVETLGEANIFFTQIQISGAAYIDILGDGRSIFASRALVGSIQGGSNLSLPPDQRLYAGGSGTVRGFRYQSIGPTFDNGDAQGATSVDALSLEWRQRLWEHWGFATFVDGGQAGTSSLPFDGKFNIGVGGGVRYYTAIGALRLDVGVPLTHVPENDSFQLYISLGQAF